MAKRTVKKQIETKDLDPAVRKILEDDSPYLDDEADMEDMLYEDEEAAEIIDVDTLEITPISALKEGQNDISIQGVIETIGQKSNAIDYVCVQTMVVDDSGEIKVTFWNDDVAQVKIGKHVIIPKGYVSSFKGQLQFNANRRYGVKFK